MPETLSSKSIWKATLLEQFCRLRFFNLPSQNISVLMSISLDTILICLTPKNLDRFTFSSTFL